MFLRVYPNPFRTATTVLLELRQPLDLSVRVFDPRGRLLRTLGSGPARAGPEWLAWDGRDASGTPVAAGIYYLRIEAPSIVLGRRLVLVR